MGVSKKRKKDPGNDRFALFVAVALTLALLMLFLLDAYAAR